MRIRRGKFVAGCAGIAAAAALLRYPAGAAEFTFRWAIDVTADHPMGVRSIEAAAKIEQESGGRIEMRTFPNGALGGQSQVLGQVRLGAIELCNCGDFLAETIAPLAAMSTIPFTFTTHKQGWDAMDGALGKFMNAAIAKAGVFPFERTWDAGFRQIYNSQRPIHTAADVKGLKLRIPDSPTWTALFKGLGMTPVPVTSAEAYTALQTHLLDASEMPLIAYQVRRLWEVNKYAAITNHVWTGYRQLANPDAWQRLPKNLKDVVDRNINAAAVKCREDIVKTDATLEAQLKGEGVTFTEADVPSFKAAVRAAGLYGEWRNQYGSEAWGLLEKSVGPLG